MSVFSYIFLKVWPLYRKRPVLCVR